MSLILLMISAKAAATLQIATCVNELCTPQTEGISVVLAAKSDRLQLDDIPSSRLREVESFAKNLGLDWSFELDGCNKRAQMLAIGLAKELKISAGIMSVQEEVTVTSRFIPWNPDITWGHHVAAFIQVEGQYFILDFAMFDHPVPVEQWLGKVRNPYLQTPLQVEIRDRFFANASDSANRLHDWHDMDLESYRQLRLNSPKLSNTAVPQRDFIMKAMPQLWQFTFAERHIQYQHELFSNPKSLQDIFVDENTAITALEQSTGCQWIGSDQKNLCTSYVQSSGQTCYFQFTATSSLDIEVFESLICF